MSKTIKKLYKQYFKQLITEYGFKQKNNTYFRLVNDQIYQNINLRIHRFGHEFTIKIGIIPVCMGIEWLDMPTFGIGENISGEEYSWEFGMIDSLEREEVVSQAFKVTMETVLPILNEITCYDKYLSHMPELRKKVYGDDIQPDGAILWVHVQTKNYIEAIKILNWYEKQNITAIDENMEFYSQNKKLFNKGQQDEYLRKAQIELAELRQFRNELVNRDEDSLNQRLINNIQKSWKLLEKYGMK
jgi:hypothetical protein